MNFSYDGKSKGLDISADVSSAIRIRMRGNSSREFDKPSYAIRLVDKKGENNPLSIMGMDAHHEWVLYGPWLDKTAIRNYMFYNLAGEMMSYAPNGRFSIVSFTVSPFLGIHTGP